MIPHEELSIRLLLTEAEAARGHNNRERAIALIRAIYAIIDGVQEKYVAAHFADRPADVTEPAGLGG